MNEPITTISSEALAIAAEHAELAGKPLAQWLAEAINEHAARQLPRVEIPVDDCGFYSPHSLPAARSAA